VRLLHQPDDLDLLRSGVPHLMVSRQETARPLLTPGEVMQLAPSDELILVSGLPPIRCRKIRYYEDPQLQARTGEAPMSSPSSPSPDDWSCRPPIAPPPVRHAVKREDGGEGGLDPVADLEAAEPPAPKGDALEFLFDDDDEDRTGHGHRRSSGHGAQGVLDLDDGMGV